MAKKSFKDSMEAAKDNVALAFIGSEPEAQEPKSKRLNLLIRPGTLKAITKIATMQRTSVNDLINTVLEAYAADNTDTITAYNNVFGEEI